MVVIFRCLRLSLSKIIFCFLTKKKEKRRGASQLRSCDNDNLFLSINVSIFTFF